MSVIWTCNLLISQAVEMTRSRSRSPRRERRRSTSRERERRRRERPRSRSRSPKRRHRSRSRSPRRRRSISPRRRSRSRSPNASGSGERPPPKKEERKKLDAETLQNMSEEDQEMYKIMGFVNFDSTKGKKTEDSTNAADAQILEKRKYRQYMNRRGGFNRPLDFIAWRIYCNGGRL